MIKKDNEGFLSCGFHRRGSSGVAGTPLVISSTRYRRHLFARTRFSLGDASTRYRGLFARARFSSRGANRLSERVARSPGSKHNLSRRARARHESPVFLFPEINRRSSTGRERIVEPRETLNYATKRNRNARTVTCDCIEESTARSIDRDRFSISFNAFIMNSCETPYENRQLYRSE